MNMKKSLYQNAKKPEGAGGVFMMNRMNERHRHMAKWGFSNIEVKKDDIALDVGCGGGANLSTLLEKISDGTVTGMDYAKVSVEISKKKNKKAVTTGRCKVIEGDVMAMPFDDESFSLVTAFETIYFWPDVKKALREIRRVLKSDGKFMICNEAKGENEKENAIKDIIEGMNIYRKEELERMLSEEGFKDISIFEKDGRDWICVTCKK